jgi:hypothetical protein
MTLSTLTAFHKSIQKHLHDMTSSQDNQNIPAAEGKTPPHYLIPETLRNWSWQRSINPHYRSCKIESMAWMESFNPSPHLRTTLIDGDFSLVCALTYPRGSHCTPYLTSLSVLLI